MQWGEYETAVISIYKDFVTETRDITAKSAAAARDLPGGTAPIRVAAALAEARRLLEADADGI